MQPEFGHVVVGHENLALFQEFGEGEVDLSARASLDHLAGQLLLEELGHLVELSLLYPVEVRNVHNYKLP